jgi:hypothetical protein
VRRSGQGYSRTPPGEGPGVGNADLRREGANSRGYLAGIGASSALLAGALLAFVILVGVATFES